MCFWSQLGMKIISFFAKDLNYWWYFLNRCRTIHIFHIFLLHGLLMSVNYISDKRGKGLNSKGTTKYSTHVPAWAGRVPWVWILRVLDQGSWNVRPDKQEFIDLGIFSQDMGFNALTRTQATGMALRSLGRVGGRKWPILREVEIPELPWKMVKGVAVLKWTYTQSSLFMVSIFVN